MRILLVSRCLTDPPYWGDRLILHHLTRELAARGHTLELLAFHLPAEVPPADGGPAYARFQPIAERVRTPLDYLRRWARPFPSAASRCWNPAMGRAITERLETRRPDLVHFFGGIQVYEFRNLVAPALPNLIVPYESYSLSLGREASLATSALVRLRLRLMEAAARTYESRIFRGFDRVVLLTEPDAAHLRRLAPGLPTCVIPNGVDLGHFRPAGARPPGSSLIFVGNLSFSPNVEAARLLIREILPRVKAEIPGANAVIVGAQPPAALAALAGPDVSITGWVPDTRPYLDRAACFVSPLRSGSGLRNKILEAMAMRLPVAATPLSCEGIEVRDGESVLFGGTAQELAGAAVRLLRDQALGQSIAQAGLRLVRQQHSWGLVADRYEMLYDAVIAGHAPGAAEALG